MTRKSKTNTKDQWDEIVYDDITHAENETIRTARRMGFASFFPYTDQQGQLTYNAALEFINANNNPFPDDER